MENNNNKELNVKIVPPKIYDRICLRNWGSICLPKSNAPKWLSDIGKAPTRAALGSGPAFENSTKETCMISSANLIGDKDIVMVLRDCVIPVRGEDEFFTLIFESNDKNALLLDKELEEDTDWIDDLLDHHPELEAYAVPKKCTADSTEEQLKTTNFSKQVHRLSAKLEVERIYKSEPLSCWENEGGASTVEHQLHDYDETLNSNLASTEDKLDELRTSLNQLSEKAKDEAENALHKGFQQIEEIKLQLKRLKDGTKPAFDELNVGMRRALNEMKKAFLKTE